VPGFAVGGGGFHFFRGRAEATRTLPPARTAVPASACRGTAGWDSCNGRRAAPGRRNRPSTNRASCRSLGIAQTRAFRRANGAGRGICSSAPADGCFAPGRLRVSARPEPSTGSPVDPRTLRRAQTAPIVHFVRSATSFGVSVEGSASFSAVHAGFSHRRRFHHGPSVTNPVASHRFGSGEFP
jgi:hypothetical protein